MFGQNLQQVSNHIGTKSEQEVIAKFDKVKELIQRQIEDTKENSKTIAGSNWSGEDNFKFFQAIELYN